jgi:flagellar biosynthesis protein FlhG
MFAVNDQAHRLRELAHRHGISSAKKKPVSVNSFPAKSIAVTSGKGGVGKSNLALFLASAFATAGKRVLLLDADLGLANLHILLGIAPKHTIAQVIEGSCSLEQTITPCTGEFDLIPGASGLEELALLNDVRVAQLQCAFNELEHRYDLMLIDTGAGIGSVVTRFASGTDMTLIVMTPEPTSLADAYAMVKVLYERGVHTIGVIVNMAVSDRDGREIFDKLNALVIKFLKRSLQLYGTLPMYREVGRYVRRQRLLLLEKKNTVFSMRIHGVARRLGGLPARAKTGFFERLFHRAEEGNGSVI